MMGAMGMAEMVVMDGTKEDIGIVLKATGRSSSR